METIFDVLRLLVTKARPVLTDAEIAAAHKIIDDHEAKGQGLDPAPEGSAGA